TLGSDPVTGMLPAAPENSMSGAMWFTVGAEAPLTATVVESLPVPAQVVTASVRLTFVSPPTVGAV
ncbi:MAG: hypothetical protein ACXV5R_07505, partial [Candidatus Angelobacter sp.]